MKDATAAALLWSLVVFGSGQSSADVPDITQQSFIDDCVKEHNRARSSVQPAARAMKDVVGRTSRSADTSHLWLFPSPFSSCAGITEDGEMLRTAVSWWRCGVVCKQSRQKVTK